VCEGINLQKCRERWLYLAVLLDLYSRTVIGLVMSYRLTVELAEQALTMALANRASMAWLLHHSDCGSQYAATSSRRPRRHGQHEPQQSLLGQPLHRKLLRDTQARARVPSALCPSVTTRHGTSSNTLRCSTIGSAGTRSSAMTPQPSMKQGRQWL